jgi:hypothetical protein
MTNKVIIVNYLALEKKYQRQNLKPILDALHRLIAADKARGIASRVIDISNAAQMRAYRGRAVTSPVSSPKSERQAKDAVDAIYAATKADYLVLLDSWDVIPHLTLANHIRQDDRTVPSDLPYASDAPFTSPDPRTYAAATRVVGRIPGLTGAKEPSYLVRQIDTAAKYKSRRHADYLKHLGLSAWQWRQSTAESVNAIFDSRKTVTCPDAGSPTIQKRLKPLTHFINCHGSPHDPQFYGQRGKGFPVAMTSADVAKAAKRNTIVAAECCFGAQLFNPGDRGQWPIANTYLGAGAIAFLGSSTIAYGPPGAGNAYADLLTQYFLIDVLRGASTGRALLQARQKFVLEQKMEDPANLKTLAQFMLFGDPSLHPCRAAGTRKVIAEQGGEAAARAIRRIFLRAAGQNAADSSGFTGKKVVRRPPNLHKQVTKIARQRGFRARPQEIDFFEVVGGKDYGRELRARGVQQRVIMLAEVDRSRLPPKSEYKGPRIRVLVAHAHDNRLIDVTEYVSR